MICVVTQFEIQFVGDVDAAKSALALYFDTADGVDSFADNIDREWQIRAGEDTDATDMPFTLITPMLDVSDRSDQMQLHDVLLMLKMTKKVCINNNCGMHINIPAPSDGRKLGLYYEKYIERQYEQIEAFDASVSTARRKVKLYKYEACGFEIDTIGDIIVSLIADYGSFTSTGIEVASKFALDFSRVITHNELQFKAFNSSFDDTYILRAAEWVNDFIRDCNETWNNGWKDEYVTLRLQPDLMSVQVTKF